MSKKSKQQELPAEIVHEILINLPVKTLSRFKSVCKSWSSFITSPQFQQDHYHLSERKPLLLAMRYCEPNCVNRIHDYTLHFFTYDSAKVSSANNFNKNLPGPQPSKSFLPIQSCRGLVCIASVCGIVHVCNPSTEEIISLPKKWFTSCIGFGYSTPTAEFKVVKYFFDGMKTRCKVCIVGTGVWREATGPPCRLRQCWAPFIHGALHLMPYFVGRSENHDIAAFNVHTQEYQSIPLPKYTICFGYEIVNLKELGGSLSLTFDFMAKKGQLELWFLKDYYNGEWVKGHIIDLSQHNVPSPWDPRSVRAVEILGSNTVFLNVSASELWVYDLQEKIVTRKIPKEFELKTYHLNSTFYVESFFALGR